MTEYNDDSVTTTRLDPGPPANGRLHYTRSGANKVWQMVPHYEESPPHYTRRHRPAWLYCAPPSNTRRRRANGQCLLAFELAPRKCVSNA